MAKRTKRRNTRRRVSKKNKTKRRKTRRIRRKMRGGESWICKGCGVMTNQNPCKVVIGREKYTHTFPDGRQEIRGIDIFCNTPKPNPFDSLNPFKN